MVKDATIVIHGSSLSGQSFKDKGGGSRFFDVGRDSDYDVAIASETLWKLAADVGIKIRGDHSEPLTAEGIAALGLKKAYDSANFLARREVNFMLYENEKTAHQHEGAALVAPEAEDYREGMGLLHGDL
jgi:filamentous hemagglutinin